MLRQPTAEMTIAELLLVTGSNAGIAARIHEGYYMIGRHKECQIRPKSRSVSRRHCLVHHASGVLNVLDLKSTTGTIVNANRLEPHAWRQLKTGDAIRCGKVVFKVSISTAGEARDGTQKETLETGAALHEFDVAGFLAAEDDAEREERYRNIRSKNDVDSIESQTTSDTDTDIESLDTLAESFSDDDPFSDDFANPTPPAKKESKKDKQNKATAIKRPSRPSRPIKVPKTKAPKRAKSRPSVSFQLSDTAQLQTVGIILVSIAAIGLFGYQLYQFSSPASTRVVEELNY